MGKLALEQINIVKNTEHDINSKNGGPFYMEVTMNFSKCTCPVFLEISDINGTLFLDEDNYDDSSESLMLEISNIKFDKQKPFIFKAILGFSNVNFNTPIFDLYSLDFSVEVSFLIRARFCFLPLCFSKILRRKKSELLTKGGDSINPSFLSMRLHRLDDIPCIQLGIKRKFFSILNSDSIFTFNVGCMKISFDGIADFSVFVTSFSTESFLVGSNRQTVSKLECLTSIIPGEQVSNVGMLDDSIVFYFINIPLYNFGSFMDVPGILKRLSGKKGKRLLRVKTVSALVGELDVQEQSLSDIVKRCERVHFDVDDNPTNKTIKYMKIDEETVEGSVVNSLSEVPKDLPLFIEGWCPAKLSLLNLPTNITGGANKKGSSTKTSLAPDDKITANDSASTQNSCCPLRLWAHNWIVCSDECIFNIALNQNHPLHSILKQVFSEGHGFIDFSNIKSSVKLGVKLNGVKYLEISLSHTKSNQSSSVSESNKQPRSNEESSESGEENGMVFDDIMLVSVKILQKFTLTKDDVKILRIAPSEIRFGEHRIIPPDLFHISIDYPRSINIVSSNNDVFPIYMFKKNSQHSIIFEHLFSSYLNSNFVQIDSTLDLSTYGFLEGSQKKNNAAYIINSTEESFIRMDVPDFTFSVTNSFMKLRANVLPTSIEYSLSPPVLPRKLPYCRGVVNMMSALIFQKTWDRRKAFVDAFNSEIVSVTLANRMFCFNFSINELCYSNAGDSSTTSSHSNGMPDYNPNANTKNDGSGGKRRGFMRVFPMEITYDHDNPLGNMSYVKFTISHTCSDDRHLLEDYMKIRDTEMYSNHGLYSHFDQSKILFAKLNYEVESPFYIKNILRAKEGTLIGFIRGIPFCALETFDRSVVVTLTTKSAFLYLTNVAKVYFRLVSPDEVREYLKSPEDWVGSHPLHFLADFILEAICRDACSTSTSITSSSRLRSGNIYVSAGIDIKNEGSKSAFTGRSIFNNSKAAIDKGEEMIVYLRIAVPKVLLKKVDCVRFNIYGTFLFESINEQDSPFSVQIDLKSEELDYVLELNSTINSLAFKRKVQCGATFNSRSIGVYHSSLHELCCLFTEFILSFKSSFPNDFIYEINYVSEEMRRAFCFNSESPVDFFYVIDTIAAKNDNSTYTMGPSVYLPPVIDIGVYAVEGSENSIKLYTNLGLDLFVNFLGEYLYTIFSSLPIDVWPDSVKLDVDFHDFFTYKCLLERDNVISTLFYLKFLILKNRIFSLKIPINPPPKTPINVCGGLGLKSNPITDQGHRDSRPSVYDDSKFVNDYVPVSFYSPNSRPGIFERLFTRCKDYFFGVKYKNLVNFTPGLINTSFKLPPQVLDQYTAYRNRIFSLKNENKLEFVFEIGSDDFGQIIMNLVSDSETRIIHNLTEPFNSCISKFIECTMSPDKSPDPFFVFNMNSRNLSLLSIRVPFTVRFIDEPAYLIGYANSFVRFVIMLNGCFMDSYMASRGYCLNIPIFFPTVDSRNGHTLPFGKADYKEYHNCGSGGYFRFSGNVKQLKIFMMFKNIVICQNINIQAKPFGYNFMRLIDWLCYMFSKYETADNIICKFCIVNLPNRVVKYIAAKVNIFKGQVVIIEFGFPVDLDFLKGYGTYDIDSDRIIRTCLLLSESYSRG